MSQTFPAALLAVCVGLASGVNPISQPTGSAHLSTSMQADVVNLMAAGPITSYKPICYKPDSDIVTEIIGFDTEPLMENFQAALKERGLATSGTRADLMKRLADAYRIQSLMPPGAKPDSVPGLSKILDDYAEQYSPNDAAPILFAKAATRINKELYLTSPDRPILKNVTLEGLQAAATERALAASGTVPILVDRIWKFVKDCDDIQEYIPGFECTVGKIEDALNQRGMSRLGAKEELTARLADAMRVGRSFVAVMDTELCDITTGGSICLGGGQRVLAPRAVPKGLVSYYSFDDNKGLDTSGKANHAKEAPKFGPGLASKGTSAKFDGKDWLELPDHKMMESMDFTVTFWIYLLQDSTGQWRTIFHKGSKDHERTPTIFLEPLTRGIEFFVSTTDVTQPAGERLWSNSFVPLKRWTHLAAVAEGHSLRLYINGLLDSENTTSGRTVVNKGPIYVGNDPWRPSGGMAGYIDEFKYYARAMTTDEIQAEAGQALGGVEPSFVELGCLGCSLDNAVATCRRGYHLCNTRDIYSSAYMVARAMGWATSNSKIWTAEESVGNVNASLTGLTSLAAVTGTGLSGLGLCCADSE